MYAIEIEMRDWLLECFSDEYDQEQIEELTYIELTQSVDKYYDGGMKGFTETLLMHEIIKW